MADPSNADDPFPDDDEEERGGGESTVSMTSPTFDPSIQLPISVPPPAMHGPGGALPNMLQIPTAPVPFTPSGPSPTGMPQQGRPAAGAGPSMPTPFGGLTPGAPNAGPFPKPLPAAGAAPIAASPVPGAGGIANMKRPQTVIGLAPPPVGAPRPGAPGGGRVPLPSGRVASSPRGAAVPAPSPSSGPASEKGPPSSGRAVRPPAIPASQPKAPPPPSSNKLGDADATDQRNAVDGNETPDSQREDSPTMAKSLGESLALFGLDAGLSDAARSVVAKPGTPKPPLVGPAAGMPPAQEAPAPPPSNMFDVPNADPLPKLHDGEEEESTRAVSREEMMRGHDAVIMAGDGDHATGEDATLAVMPGMNEANGLNLAGLAESLGDVVPPSHQQPFDPGFPQQQYPQQGGYPQQQGGYPQQPPQYGYPDPNQQQPYMQQQPQYGDPAQQAYAQSLTPQQAPQQPWPQDPYQQAGMNPAWNNQAYPGSVGPVSGPHLPVQAPISQPHFPGATPYQPSGQMPTQQSPQMGMPGGPIPYPGQAPMMHQQQPQNPFGDWNQANQPPNLAGTGKAPFKISGQVLLLGIVGLVCLAIFITGIILFVTTKF